MAVYNIRYAPGSAPQGANEDSVLSIEAAIYVTEGDFIDFYSRAEPGGMGQEFVPRGEVLHRVRKDIVLDISKVS